MAENSRPEFSIEVQDLVAALSNLVGALVPRSQCSADLAARVEHALLSALEGAAPCLSHKPGAECQGCLSADSFPGEACGMSVPQRLVLRGAVPVVQELTNVIGFVARGDYANAADALRQLESDLRVFGLSVQALADASRK